ncbi:MAG: hypothetical protein AB7G47_10110 [Mycolicibacterium sp.]|uniref:hypothetical protein n=1 Tax=Mycolicibacterium sp. TaxID=2320850 RepID=UPI003D0DEECA
MTDWGAVSSWVAAGISMATFGAGTIRAWWNRAEVEWALSADLKMGRFGGESTWMEGSGTFLNFGDGPAHRVSVFIHRANTNAKKSQLLATSPLVKPGDVVEFDFGVSIEHLDDTHVWVTWTPPPIRRRREVSSPRIALKDHVQLSDNAGQRVESYRKKSAGGQS